MGAVTVGWEFFNELWQWMAILYLVALVLRLEKGQR
jgi:hypothetical protein